jgi:hypothetical protein
MVSVLVGIGHLRKSAIDESAESRRTTISRHYVSKLRVCFNVDGRSHKVKLLAHNLFNPPTAMFVVRIKRSRFGPSSAVAALGLQRALM